MEDYTKFRLKTQDELISLLEHKDNLFVVSCNKCFKEFKAEDEPECSDFIRLLVGQKKNITGFKVNLKMMIL